MKLEKKEASSAIDALSDYLQADNVGRKLLVPIRRYVGTLRREKRGLNDEVERLRGQRDSIHASVTAAELAADAAKARVNHAESLLRQANNTVKALQAKVDELEHVPDEVQYPIPQQVLPVKNGEIVLRPRKDLKTSPVLFDMDLFHQAFKEMSRDFRGLPPIVANERVTCYALEHFTNGFNVSDYVKIGRFVVVLCMMGATPAFRVTRDYLFTHTEPKVGQAEKYLRWLRTQP